MPINRLICYFQQILLPVVLKKSRKTAATSKAVYIRFTFGMRLVTSRRLLYSLYQTAYNSWPEQNCQVIIFQFGRMHPSASTGYTVIWSDS